MTQFFWSGLIVVVFAGLALYFLRSRSRSRPSSNNQHRSSSLDETGVSAATLIAKAFPELKDHAAIESLLQSMGFKFGQHSGFVPSARPVDLEALTNGIFSPMEAGKAFSLLMSLTDDETNGEAARVRLAALRISGGSLPELERAVRRAKVDFRDVAVEAETMHKFVGDARPLAPGVPDRSTEVFREYVLWVLQHLQPEEFRLCGPVGK